MSYHIPVLLQETIAGLGVTEGKSYIDATLGGGGHTRRMLALGAKVLSIDTDEEAIQEGKKIQNSNLTIVQGNFKDIERIAHEEQFYPIDGILFDLGVSSHQLDVESRGFSYRFAQAPFDLRLNQQIGIPASDIIHRESEEQIRHIIATYGEEEECGSLAREIVRKRGSNPIATTGDVLTIIEEVTGAEKRNETASRVFQAFRIAVNDELLNLKKGLQGALKLVRPGGRIAVISFHSLEDRIVKQFFQTADIRNVTKKPIVPTHDEQRKNKRSRSAKLRIAEIL